MEPLFKCVLYYFPSDHLSQLYSGFELLQEYGVINITIKQITGNSIKPLLKILLDDKITIYYDALDGLNWIDGTVEENINYFKTNIKADYYFKRSYNKQIVENVPKGCKVFPLGLNYPIPTNDFDSRPIKETIKNYLGNIKYISNSFGIVRNPFSSDFEFYPIPNKTNKILFIARLWNPDEAGLAHLKYEREKLNDLRISCIKSCKKEFGEYFIGGLQKDNFSTKYYPDLIIPPNLTKRKIFLDTIKQSNICIATTGLHNSIGWKFGEYVAASRAIISEPLHYEIPGNFEKNKNYLSFTNDTELISNIYLLMNNRDLILDMMTNNFQYYNNFVRPDNLVLNTILTVYRDQYLFS